MKVEAGKWRETTVMNHKPKLETLMQVLGRETPVSQITVDQCREYTRILEGLPPSFSLKGYKDLSAVSSSELAGKHDQTMDLTTRREYLNLARSLFQYALENEYIEKNPLIPGLIPPKKGNTRSLRSAFSKEDIKRIFNPETFNKWAGDSPARYWVPNQEPECHPDHPPAPGHCQGVQGLCGISAPRWQAVPRAIQSQRQVFTRLIKGLHALSSSHLQDYRPQEKLPLIPAYGHGLPLESSGHGIHY
jgi:hypothetical protein